MQQRSPEDRPIAALLAPDILALLEESPNDVAAETEELHPRDLADVVELLPAERVRDLLAALSRPRAADVLEYLDEDLRTEIIEAMSARDAAELVTQMTPDDRADTLEELDERRAEEILSEIPRDARRETEELLRYEPDTAGGIMTTEFVSVSADTPVEEALENVRALARTGRREAMYAIYTTDPQGRISGVLSIRELLAAPPGTKIGDIAWTEVRSVIPQADRESVARLCADYDLVAVPVVSESGHIMGVITVDDVIDAIQEEQTEDVQKFGGMQAIDEPYMQTGIWHMIRKRAGWLAVLCVGEMFTASAMGYFQDELDKAIVLSLFIPLIVSSGGNSGSQATSLIIRALALNEVTLADWWRVARREVLSGLALGLLLGALGFARVELWQVMGLGRPIEHHTLVALAVGISLVGVVMIGSVAGSMLPFALRRLGFDPASASAPFVATIVDVTGVVLYFAVALMLLSGTLLK
jgi:magnesium transporter